ncbi:erf2p [Stylonychia lemnae]|uniref:Palmitoyltransferase n=1 Tax=Stylonychia lemnae TaxID=5949 RepID=A0A078AGX8_STYLE|nr:erf2p [Stylonychia lemnae]|eukprot:CDW80113.1 erf2p [Stylonychia lemnae]
MAYFSLGSKKLGVEFAFAMFSYFYSISVQYWVIQHPDIGGYEKYLFWFVCLYEFVIYFNVALCDPGRLDEKQKLFQKYEELLRKSKEDPENFIPTFETNADEIIYQNYFLPCDLINSQNSDERKFKFCNKCNVFKLPRMHHCSICNRCCVKYDHHCGLAINCIGVNNYHLFIVFLHASITFLLFSFAIALKYTVYDYRWEVFSTTDKVLAVILLIHNPLTAYYNYALITMYTKTCRRNMHAVEESIIGSTYDKGKFHKLQYGKNKKFYFSRTNEKGEDIIWENIKEMMTSGGRGDPVLRWFIPIPYKNRQDYSDILSGQVNDPNQIKKAIIYMKFDKNSLRDLTMLEYNIEKKVEQDLLNSGFRLKRRIEIPKCLRDQIGDLKID